MKDKKNLGCTSFLDSTTFSGKFREYRIELKDGTLHITDTVANRDGTKRLSDGELLNFSDINGFKIKFTKGRSVYFNFERDGEGVLLYASGDNDAITGYFGNNNVIFCGRDNDTISVLSYNTIDGGDGNDTIDVRGSDNSVQGGKGNDIIKCPEFHRHNNIDGGDGDDRIEVGTFSFAEINGGAGIDTLKWAINSQFITYYIKHGWMKLKNGGVETGKGIFLKNIERLEFNDKTFGLAYSSQNNTPVNGSASDDIILGDDRSNTLSGDHGNDTIYGGEGNDTIYGGEGNDTIDGGNGDDIISGDRGDDKLSGGKGNDTYRFSRFDGNDTIRDKDTTPNNQDQILFGEGIASDQLWFSKKGNDLYIQVIGTTDSITINQHYVDESYRIERFQLANGKALSVAKIDALVSAMSAFAPPKAGQMTLPDNYQKELNATIAASWQ